MLIVATRALILFLIVFLAVRVMGKRELGQLQPYEFVIAIMIANLATVPMADMGIPILNGIVPILTLLFAHVGLTFLTLKSRVAQKFIDGAPTILVSKGYIHEDAMRSAGYSFTDLMEQLRVGNIFSLGDVEYVILETSGQVSIIPKAAARPVTVRDLNLAAGPDPLPWSVIVDGELQRDALRLSGRDERWLLDQLEAMGMPSIPHILYASVDDTGKIIAQRKNERKWWQL